VDPKQTDLIWLHTGKKLEPNKSPKQKKNHAISSEVQWQYNTQVQHITI